MSESVSKKLPPSCPLCTRSMEIQADGSYRCPVDLDQGNIKFEFDVVSGGWIVALVELGEEDAK
jgi:hypothetical protein